MTANDPVEAFEGFVRQWVKTAPWQEDDLARDMERVRQVILGET